MDEAEEVLEVEMVGLSGCLTDPLCLMQHPIILIEVMI